VKVSKGLKVERRRCFAGPVEKTATFDTANRREIVHKIAMLAFPIYNRFSLLPPKFLAMFLGLEMVERVVVGLWLTVKPVVQGST
jgi:hypothetical protein